MTEVTSYLPGDFCWVELTTSDGADAKRFYTQLFGWGANELPMGPDQPPYVMAQKAGKDVAAMYENKKVPAGWLSYVSVASADESAGKATSLGGNVVAPPFDVMDVGRMAVAQDPQGARFAVWQPRRHIGARLIDEPGTMCWNELMTTDVESARKFYSGLFNWRLKVTPEYTEASVGDVATAGMMQMDERMRGVPPHWMPYFCVFDCDVTAKKAKGLGATAHVEPADIPNVGRFAVFGDPQGALFAVIQIKEAA
jgi:predicted enzyme related to lactoylglutathione lyase